MRECIEKKIFFVSAATLKDTPLGIRSSEELKSAELSFSSFFARELDRFLFPNLQDGAC